MRPHPVQGQVVWSGSSFATIHGEGRLNGAYAFDDAEQFAVNASGNRIVLSY